MFGHGDESAANPMQGAEDELDHPRYGGPHEEARRDGLLRGIDKAAHDLREAPRAVDEIALVHVDDLVLDKEQVAEIVGPAPPELHVGYPEELQMGDGVVLAARGAFERQVQIRESVLADGPQNGALARKNRVERTGRTARGLCDGPHRRGLVAAFDEEPPGGLENSCARGLRFGLAALWPPAPGGRNPMTLDHGLPP